MEKEYFVSVLAKRMSFVISSASNSERKIIEGMKDHLTKKELQNWLKERINQHLNNPSFFIYDKVRQDQTPEEAALDFWEFLDLLFWDLCGPIDWPGLLKKSLNVLSGVENEIGLDPNYRLALKTYRNVSIALARANECKKYMQTAKRTLKKAV